MTAEPGTRTMKADAAAMAEAVRCLAAGGLVAFPTETVYGLGADARNGEAVARLYAAKGRPSFNPLIAHVATLAAARRLAQFDRAAEALAAAFWPGPLTLVLPRRTDCSVAGLALAGLDSVAVRVLAHLLVAQTLLKPNSMGQWSRPRPTGPVVMLASTSAAHVLADLRGRIDLVIDAGPCAARRRRVHYRRVSRSAVAASPRRQVWRGDATSNACSAHPLADAPARRAKADRARHAGVALRAENEVAP